MLNWWEKECSSLREQRVLKLSGFSEIEKNKNHLALWNWRNMWRVQVWKALNPDWKIIDNWVSRDCYRFLHQETLIIPVLRRSIRHERRESRRKTQQKSDKQLRVVAQLSKYTNSTDLYILKNWILWYVNNILMKLLFKARVKVNYKVGEGL